jgi:hypothetical protein
VCSSGRGTVKLCGVSQSDINAIDLIGASPDGQWVSFAGRFRGDEFTTVVVPVYGGQPRVLCYNACKARWSPDDASLYLAIGVEPSFPTLVVPLQPGQSYPDFPTGSGDALTAWRKLPNARLLERPDSIPGLDQSTYIVTKLDERRNLFRVPLQ